MRRGCVGLGCTCHPPTSIWILSKVGWSGKRNGGPNPQPSAPGILFALVSAPPLATTAPEWERLPSCM